MNTGDAVLTNSGNLKEKGIKFVIHAVGPIWQNGNNNEKELLRACVWNSLKQSVDSNLIQTISIPAISSGIFGFPKETCALIMINTIRDFIEDHKQKLKEIRMTNFDEPTVEIFLDKIKEMIKTGALKIDDIIEDENASREKNDTKKKQSNKIKNEKYEEKNQNKKEMEKNNFRFFCIKCVLI